MKKFDLTHHWYRKQLTPVTMALWPFACLFSLLINWRCRLYRSSLLKAVRVNVPVIVVGNLTVGGTGKTPFVIWLTQYLQAQGYRTGIVSRGAGGKKQRKPYWVREGDHPAHVGDEALLLQRHAHCPVVIGRDRPAAVAALLANTACDVIISDDGLQHYRLARDVEIVLVDGERQFGNGCLLPAGPLREPVSRLKAADLVVTNGDTPNAAMQLVPLAFHALNNSSCLTPVEFLSRYPIIHAVAGTGHPQRFFRLLEKLGLMVIPHVFPDHYLYRAQDLVFAEPGPIVMTEKDAVKCKVFADERCWFLGVRAEVDSDIGKRIVEMLALKRK